MTLQTGHGPQSDDADMAEHLRTWRGFKSFMTWQAIAAGIILALLAIFRMHG